MVAFNKSIRWAFFALPGLLMLLSGCGGLTPFAEVRNALPDDEFLRIDGRWVHIDRAGDGPALVLIHGFGGSTFAYRKVIPALANSFDVIAVDLNGFGYTERPRSPSDYSIDGQVRLVLAVMDELDVPSAHMLGHSYGAGVVLRMAERDPDRVDTLTLVAGGAFSGAPGGGLIPRLLQPIAFWIIENFLLTPPRIREALESSVVDNSLVDSDMVNGYLARLRVEGLRDALSGFLSREALHRRGADASAIDKRTLIIWGVQDGVIPIRVGEQLAEVMPDAVLVRFESVGHLPMEEVPHRFVETVTEFLTP